MEWLELDKMAPDGLHVKNVVHAFIMKYQQTDRGKVRKFYIITDLRAKSILERES
jgi:hypothetical protein